MRCKINSKAQKKNNKIKIMKNQTNKQTNKTGQHLSCATNVAMLQLDHVAATATKATTATAAAAVVCHSDPQVRSIER